MAVLLAASLWAGGAAACHATVAATVAVSYDDPLLVYAKASSATSGGFLSLDAAAPGVDGYTVFDAASGPATFPQSMAQYAKQVVVPFKLTPKLERTHWLNVSRTIGGVFYWTSAAAGGAGHDNTYFRFELLVNGERIAGDDCPIKADSASGTWNPVVVRLRTEARVFEASDELSLRITRFNGVADFQVGTGGNHQTYFEFRTYNRDPLASNLYLEGRRLEGLPQPSQGETTGSEGATAAPPVVPLAFLSLFVAILRPRKAQGLALLLLVGALAGCVGEPTAGGNAVPDDGRPQPSVSANYTKNDTLGKAGVGAIRGTVSDSQGVLVRGAQLVVFGTSLAATTDASGYFEFGNVTPGNYRIRIDKGGFDPLERDVQVETGAVLDLKIVIVRKGLGAPGTAPHPHDDWGGETKKTIWSGDFLPFSGTYSATSPVTQMGFCPYFYTTQCEGLIDLGPALKPVLAGTVTVEIRLTWNIPAVGAKEFGLRVATPRNSDGTSTFVPRGPGEPFRVQIFPDEADPGHQEFSQWVLYTRVPGTSAAQNALWPPVTPTTKVHLEAVAYKGVIPFEPRHTDRWEGKTEMVLVKEVLRGPGGCIQPCDYPPTTATSTGAWQLGSGLWVPPGTKEIRGTMTWSNPTVAVGGTAWTIAYKGANSANAKPLWTAPKVTAPGTNKVDFTIQPDPKEFDQYYQTTSYWAFAPDDKAAPVCQYQGSGCQSVNTGYGTTWALSATAYKDPDYVPSSA